MFLFFHYFVLKEQLKEMEPKKIFMFRLIQVERQECVCVCVCVRERERERERKGRSVDDGNDEVALKMTSQINLKTEICHSTACSPLSLSLSLSLSLAPFLLLTHAHTYKRTDPHSLSLFFFSSPHPQADVKTQQDTTISNTHVFKWKGRKQKYLFLF